MNRRFSALLDSEPLFGRVPQLLGEEITVFRAAQQPDWPGMHFCDETNGWGHFAARVEVEHLDTTHQRMFDEPAVRELAHKFTACQQRALARTAARMSRISLLPGALARAEDRRSHLPAAQLRE